MRVRTLFGMLVLPAAFLTFVCEAARLWLEHATMEYPGRSMWHRLSSEAALAALRWLPLATTCVFYLAPFLIVLAVRALREKSSSPELPSALCGKDGRAVLVWIGVSLGAYGLAWLSGVSGGVAAGGGLLLLFWIAAVAQAMAVGIACRVTRAAHQVGLWWVSPWGLAALAIGLQLVCFWSGGLVAAWPLLKGCQRPGVSSQPL